MATKGEIKQAYRDMVKQCHPDLHPDDSSKAAQFRRVQEAYEAVRDVKSTGATNQPKRPFRQRNEQTEQHQHRDPGMDHEHNWQQRMKIRQEWERQGRERKDRERKRYAERKSQSFESQHDRAARAHHRMNDARYQFEDSNADIVEEVRRAKRAEYEAWMARRERVESVTSRSGPVAWMFKLTAPIILSALFITAWAEWQQGRQDAAMMRDAQFRSMVAWNQQNRERQNERFHRQNELIEQSNDEQLSDGDARILDVLEHNSKALKNRRS